MIRNLPVLDSHIHLDPKGAPREAVNRFLQAGGTHLLIIHKPYHHIPETDISAYERSYDTTLEMVDLARDLGTVSWCVLGPYPGSLPHQIRNMGMEEAIRLQTEAMELAIQMNDDDRVIGLGEIGRIHFPVEPEIQERCEDVLLKGLTGARSLGCPVVLHTESPSQNRKLFEHLAFLADKSGLEKHRMIKHHSGWEAAIPDSNRGISVSVQARRSNIEKGLSKGLEFLLETDYIDDLERPDVVMPPDTVPKKIEWAYRRGLIDEIKHERLMIELPKRILGVDTFV
jgi:TatD-related deoxyribonuclease